MFDPKNCYDIKEVRHIELRAMKEIPAIELMERAGKSVFDKIVENKLGNKILVFCGPGNNAGDGYVVARLAHEHGMDVKILYTTSSEKLEKAAKISFKKCKEKNVPMVKFSLSEDLSGYDCIVDALLGIGIDREVESPIQEAIEKINSFSGKVISVDVPSGLDVDVGFARGIAVRADYTVTFIAMKAGLMTCLAANHIGKLFCDNLNLDDKYYEGVIVKARLLSRDLLKEHVCLCRRKPCSHKGNYGHLLIIGGYKGMPGSVRLAGEAALRAGVGQVTILTHPAHAHNMAHSRPELMVHPIRFGRSLTKYLALADAIVIGPGLSESNWGKNIWKALPSNKHPVVVDASALRLLAKSSKTFSNWILTPHPGEASDLLGRTAIKVQKDRFSAVKEIQEKYNGVVVLKGAGTIIYKKNGSYSICPYGNPGMASAGMGDVLSGIIGSFVAQGYTLETAAKLGVLVHSRAGDLAAGDSPCGMVASDLMPFIRKLVNCSEKINIPGVKCSCI